MFQSGSVVSHSAFQGGEFKLFTVLSEDHDSWMLIKSGEKKPSKFMKKGNHLRAATEEELSKHRLDTFFSTYEHSDLAKVYIQWLREAGEVGVVNDCGHAKNEFYNYTCSCRTLVKLYHRFSVFKDNLTNKKNNLGFVIEDREMENGKHRTILISEPAFPALTSKAVN